ncbi:2Fe-2S iron-sulfur cluster-binding protein [Bacillaceae bacterium]
MPTITFLTNDNKQIEVPEGSNLLRTSMRYEGGIPFKCGGGLCGTCKVKIEEGLENVDKIKKHEQKHLSEEKLNEGYRLACQTFITGDVKVSWNAEFARKLAEAQRRQKERRKKAL